MAGGKWWGTPQIEQVGIYEYGTSPFHLKLFKGTFTTGLFKVSRSVGKIALMMAPPAFLFYSIAKWADGEFERYNRKAWLMSPEGIAAAEQ